MKYELHRLKACEQLCTQLSSKLAVDVANVVDYCDQCLVDDCFCLATGCTVPLVDSNGNCFDYTRPVDNDAAAFAIESRWQSQASDAAFLLGVVMAWRFANGMPQADDCAACEPAISAAQLDNDLRRAGLFEAYYRDQQGRQHTVRGKFLRVVKNDE